MVWVAGADGCRKGWIRVSREIETGELEFHVLENAAALLTVAPRPAVLGLDIPIGLPEQGRRECDDHARACLGWPRRNSVFPAPIRPALRAKTREAAAAITQAADGRRVGTQAWALYPKIRGVDQLLQSNRPARRRIREAHPEVCFWEWNEQRAIQAGKKTRPGKQVRLRIAEHWLGDGVLQAARGGHLKKDVADDDILDAIAALWTATRIFGGRARTLPEQPPMDSTGLRMEIVY
jgi:predicted RNase H-like nuclease